MNTATNATMPEMVDEEDLEVWAFYKSKKDLIAQSGGYGRIEFRFHDPFRDGMKLATKGYYVTHGAYNTALKIVGEEDAEVWAYYKSKKDIIKREYGHGNIEFVFCNPNGKGMKLAEKSYCITYKANKKTNPSKSRKDIQAWI